MKSITLALLTIGIALLLCACSNVSVSNYSNNTPTLTPQDFFNGNLTAHGVVKNRSGEVIRYFNATINATWKNGVGTLDEKFIFDDGEIQYRTWVLTPDPVNPHQFTGTAGDVVGTGKGVFAGNVINLHYVLSIKHNNSTINVNVNDLMWLVNEKKLLNESTLTKFGFKVGSVQLVIEKHE